MNIFDVLTLIGGLCLFLFGMNVMGQSLERRAGSGLRNLLGKLTTNKGAGFLTGLGTTAVIQSSSATTVMVVGFVNSGIMTLTQAINVIMGANVGTTVTSWILSLGGIESDTWWVKMLKPTSFTPILAFIGILFYMFGKKSKSKDTGTILLGFATLMFGMDTMSAAVSGLKDVEAFRNLFVLFENPLLGLIVGAILTAVIQSSSASVGILQALTTTGQITYSNAFPIIMGQNIGTCITAMLSSAGANKNAKRAALVHLFFNVIGAALGLGVFCVVKYVFAPPLLSGESGTEANHFGIAVAHTAFNVFCTVVLLPSSKLFEKLVRALVPDSKTPEKKIELDERLLATPSVALEQCHTVAVEMADVALNALKDGLSVVQVYSPGLAEVIRENEEKTDHYEDELGTYLVKLSSCKISDADSAEAAKLLRMIGDFERISDHGVNLLEVSEELRDKKISFSPAATKEISVLVSAVREIVDLSYKAFVNNDLHAASCVEPLEEVIDDLKDVMRKNHIYRLQQGECSIETGFIWTDLLTSLERTADHCSNIAGCMIDVAQNHLDLHESLRAIKEGSPEYAKMYSDFAVKYSIETL